jgi:hypothetical protein
MRLCVSSISSTSAFFPLVCSSLGGSTRQAGAGDGGNRGVRACGLERVGLALWVR